MKTKIFMLCLQILFVSNVLSQNDTLKISKVLFSAKINKAYSEEKRMDDTSYSGVDTFGIIANDVLHTNDTLKIFLYYKEGYKVKVEGFYPNGQLYRRVEFFKSKRNGLDEWWYQNGNICFFGYYKNGHKISPRIGWYETGELEYYGDSKTGINKEFFKNGKLKRLTILLDTSNKEGPFLNKDYYETGEISDSVVFNCGEQMHYRFYKNGKLMSRGLIYNGDIFQIGKWEDWYESGVKKAEYHYDKDYISLPQGTWKYWNEKGELVRTEQYKDGELVDSKDYIYKDNKSEKKE